LSSLLLTLCCNELTLDVSRTRRRTGLNGATLSSAPRHSLGLQVSTFHPFNLDHTRSIPHLYHLLLNLATKMRVVVYLMPLATFLKIRCRKDIAPSAVCHCALIRRRKSSIFFFMLSNILLASGSLKLDFQNGQQKVGHGNVRWGALGRFGGEWGRLNITYVFSVSPEDLARYISSPFAIDPTIVTSSLGNFRYLSALQTS
jgi:hypothetical protein